MSYFDPVSLRLFVAICEVRSITEAAERENITPSAVSKRLTALEEQIGAPLLDRGRRGVQLTAAGEALLPAARSLLQSMSRMHAELSQYAKEVHGHVRVAASMSAITEFLPTDIAAFVRRYETVRVSLDERISSEVVRSVADGRADIGVCWDAAGTRGLESLPYRADHLIVVAHRDHELAHRKQVTFAETLKYEHVAMQGSITQLTQQRNAIAEGEALRYRVQVSTFDAACRIVAANLAVAIVPKEAARPSIKAFGLRAIALSEDWALRKFVVCFRNREELGAPAGLLADALAAQWHGPSAPGSEVVS